MCDVCLCKQFVYAKMTYNLEQTLLYKFYHSRLGKPIAAGFGKRLICRGCVNTLNAVVSHPTTLLLITAGQEWEPTVMRVSRSQVERKNRNKNYFGEGWTPSASHPSPTQLKSRHFSRATRWLGLKPTTCPRMYPSYHYTITSHVTISHLHSPHIIRFLV